MRTIHRTNSRFVSLFVTFCVAFGMLLPALGLAQGVSASWDVTVAAQSLAMQASRLQPLLDQVKPQQWESGAATATYLRQLRGSQDEVRYLLGAAQALSKQPEKLSAALETYFRLQSVENQVGSLADGVRHYQDQALGDQLNTVMAANGENRDQLREYISDLAQTREQEYKIVDSEAQRCRGMILRQPAVAPAKPAAKPAVAPPAAQAAPPATRPAGVTPVVAPAAVPSPNPQSANPQSTNPQSASPQKGSR